MTRKNVKQVMYTDYGEDILYIDNQDRYCDCIGTEWQDECCGPDAHRITEDPYVDEKLKEFVASVKEAKKMEEIFDAIRRFETSMPPDVEAEITLPHPQEIIYGARLVISKVRPETDKEMAARKKREQKKIAKKKQQLEKLQAELAELEA